MTINGKTFLLKDFKNNKIEDMLRYFKLKNNMVAIELNHKILPKDEWSTTFLNNDDKVEIIKLVGGG